MIQILGIRSFVNDKGETKKYDAFYDKNWRAPSLAVLLSDIDKYVDAIPTKERWNIFYTVANCGDGKRKFESQSIMPFDLDGIDVARHEEYIKIVLDHLGLKRDSTGIVLSGNGVHILVGLKKKITKQDYFKNNSHHYKGICADIDKKFKEAGLPCEKKETMDRAVFDHRRILRLPNTENRKPNKENKQARILQHKIEPVSLDITKLSGLPEVPVAEQVPKDYMRRYPRTDREAILSGCDFLKWCKDHQGEVNEPQWYCMLSIVGRMEGGDKLCHEMSEEHPGYTHEETEIKIDQALEASGPRTCENINAYWSGCRKCENFEKVKSPIMLRGENHIPTEFTGFHFVPFTASGVPGKPVPCYEDLRKFFEVQYNYKGLGGSRMVHVWDGRQYKYMENAFIEQFAQDNFDPQANNTKISEFKSLVMRTNLTAVEWFKDTTTRKMNFQNGVLDLNTWDFMPHSKECGFRYVLPYNYDPTAKAPLFTAMLSRITQGNTDMQKVLLEYMGYSLSSDECWTQKALLMVGHGSNGKSTLISVLKELAGKGNYSSLTIDDLNRSEYNRQIFEGKLFNFSEETPTKALMDDSLFKTLVAGGEMQVRGPYKEPYFIKNSAKLIFSCNTLPKALDTSYGFYRRLIIVPFNATFKKTDKDFDPHIEQKLLGELPGIFNLCMRGYKDLTRQSGFTECETINATVEEYIDMTDTLRAWIKNNVKAFPVEDKEIDNFVPSSDIYQGYKNDMINNYEQPKSYDAFTKKLKILLPDFDSRAVRRRVEVGGKVKQVRGLLNVSFGEGAASLTKEDILFSMGKRSQQEMVQ